MVSDTGISSADARKLIAETEAQIARASMTCDKTLGLAAEMKKGSDDLDAKFQKFKDMFDQMNKAFIANLAGALGTSVPGPKAPKLAPETTSLLQVAQLLRHARKVCVLTGAGVSAESGIPTFRGADGYWTIGSENYRPQDMATYAMFNEHTEEMWRWYHMRWATVRNAAPNPA